jgi:hypothetical protein
MDPDADPEGPKTHGSNGSGGGSGSATLLRAREKIKYSTKETVIFHLALTAFFHKMSLHVQNSLFRSKRWLYKRGSIG